MIDGRRVIAWTPFGRKPTVEILFAYIERDHVAGLIDEYWLYLNTDPGQDADVAYAMRLAQNYDWVKLVDRPANVTIFAQKQRNTCYFYRYAASEPDAIFVRFDDDIVYVHPGTVKSMVNHQLESKATCTFPIIVNNARVSYLLQRQGKIPLEWGLVTDDCMDGVGWGDGEFAVRLHEKLIKAILQGTVEEEFFTHHNMPIKNEQFSISCFASKGDIYAHPYAAKLLAGAHEEEAWHSELRPNRSGTRNVVLCDALVAHLTFFTSRRHFDDGVILEQYGILAEEMT